jgi:hypothetical protein
MSPLAPLGIFAKPAAAAGDYESIATVTVGSGGSASVTFSSIPADYSHLQIRGIVRTERTGIVNDTLYVYFNTDTANQDNYARHILYGTGASALAAGDVDNSGVTTAAANDATSGVFAGFVIDILDYANTNKNTTVRTLAGFDNNGSGQVRLGSTLWVNTAAITTIKFDNSGGNDIAQYSHFALYGIKGA